MSAAPICASMILAAADEIRRAEGLVRYPDALGAGQGAWFQDGWSPAKGGVGFCDLTIAAVNQRGLVDFFAAEDGRHRVVLKPAERIRPVVALLEQELKRT